MRLNWADLIDQAEVIAVAHVVGDMRYVHRGERGTWQCVGTLAIDKALKGECLAEEIPFVLHYGLTPPTAHLKTDGRPIGLRLADPVDKRRLSIWDFGSSCWVEQPLLADARRPAVWFLGHYADRTSGSKPTGLLGVRDPEQLQPLKLLPLLRAILRPAPTAELVPFLSDTDIGVRLGCLSYLRGRKAKEALPAIAWLVGDPQLGYEAIEACAAIGGKEGAAVLRPLLADGVPPAAFGPATDALARLKDTESVPALVDALARNPGRFGWTATNALGQIGDRRAIPALIDALEGDAASYGQPVQHRMAVWSAARDALHRITGCWLSPNGDRARRWWAAAQPLNPKRWLPLTKAGQLPSQRDDELALQARLLMPAIPGRPALVIYTVTNRSKGELWLTRYFHEELRLGHAEMDCNASAGDAGPAKLSREDFVCLKPGGKLSLSGKADALDGRRYRGTRPLTSVRARVSFERKGTSLGLDAWVGDLGAAVVGIR